MSKNSIFTYFYVASFRAIASVGNLVLLFYLANAYDAHEVGKISALIAAAYGVSVLSRFGLDVTLIKHLPRYIEKRSWEKSSSLISFFIVRILIFTVIICFLCWLLELYVDSGLAQIVFISLSVSALAIMGAVTKSYLKPALSTIFEPGLSLFFSFIALLLIGSLGLNSFMSRPDLLITVSVVFYTLLVAILFFRYVHTDMLFGRFDHQELMQERKESLNFFLISVSGYTYSQGYIWVASNILDASAVAGLSIVGRLVFAVNFAMMLANTINNPKFSLLCRSQDKIGLELEAAKSLKMMMIFSAPPFLVLFFFPSEILGSFEVSNHELVYVLIIMAFSQLVNVVTGNSAAILNFLGRERWVRNTNFSVAMVAIISSIFLEKEYGVIGFSVAYACGIIVQNAILVSLLKLKEDVNIYRRLFT